MSEDELELPLVHWKGSHPTTSSIKFKVRTQLRDINPRLYSPVLYAQGMIRELISYRHELQHRLVSLPHPEERVLHIYDQARLLWHMQRMGDQPSQLLRSLCHLLSLSSSQGGLSRSWTPTSQLVPPEVRSLSLISQFDCEMSFLDGFEDACPFLPHDVKVKTVLPDTLVMQFEESILRSGRLDDGYFSLTARSSA